MNSSQRFARVQTGPVLNPDTTGWTRLLLAMAAIALLASLPSIIPKLPQPQRQSASPIQARTP